jgi:predicted enzyme related to lactoylglutathione lyase
MSPPMGERTSHAPGTFSWVDLAASDPNAAKGFYSSLFGLTADDRPIPGDGVYSMMLKDGRAACAITGTMEGQPVGWNSYVTVESADAAAAAVGEHGGRVMGEPFDVMDAGRMATVVDPNGAAFAVWEPRDSIGAEVVNEPGTLTINQLNTSDPARAQEFYTGVFGWRFEQVAEGDQPYWGIYNGDRLNGGMMEQPPDMWLAYFASESVDDDAGRIGELGGQVILPPAPIPGGRILVAQDPQGAVFALFSGRFDD